MKSKRERQAADHEAEAKRLRREEKAFWIEVEERKTEVLSRLNMSDRYEDICRTYGAYTDADKDRLYMHIISDSQVQYYARHADDSSETDNRI